MNNQQKRIIHCSLCKQEGHNIRGCNIPYDALKNIMQEYARYLYYIILYYPLNWDIKLNNNIKFYNNDNCIPSCIVEVFNNLNKKNDTLFNALYGIPPFWEPLPDIQKKAIYHAMNMYYCKNVRREVKEILHLVLLHDADRELINNYSLDNTLMYTAQTIQYYPILNDLTECLKDKCNENNIYAGFIKKSFNSIRYRENRLRFLRNHTTDRLENIKNKIINLEDKKLQIISKIKELLDKNSEILCKLKSLDLEKEKYGSFLSMFSTFSKLIAVIKIKDDENIPSIVCSICFNECDNNVKLNCNHSFCTDCSLKTIFHKYSDISKTIYCECPLCRCEISELHGNRSNIESLVKSFQDSMSINDIEYFIS